MTEFKKFNPPIGEPTSIKGTYIFTTEKCQLCPPNSESDTKAMRGRCGNCGKMACLEKGHLFGGATWITEDGQRRGVGVESSEKTKFGTNICYECKSRLIDARDHEKRVLGELGKTAKREALLREELGDVQAAKEAKKKANLFKEISEN